MGLYFLHPQLSTAGAFLDKTCFETLVLSWWWCWGWGGEGMGVGGFTVNFGSSPQPAAHWLWGHNAAHWFSGYGDTPQCQWAQDNEMITYLNSLWMEEKDASVLKVCNSLLHLEFKHTIRHLWLWLSDWQWPLYTKPQDWVNCHTASLDESICLGYMDVQSLLLISV